MRGNFPSVQKLINTGEDNMELKEKVEETVEFS